MWSDNETSEDLLGFKIHADLLIDVINDESILPVTIGVFGDWGSGKSSILKIINEELIGADGDLKDETLALYFNGWIFEGYDDAKAALLESIIKSFSEHKTIGNKVKDYTTKLLKSVNWMRVMGFGFKKIVLPVAAAHFTGGLSLIPSAIQGLAKKETKDITETLTGKEGEKILKGFYNSPKKEDKYTLVRHFRDDFKKMIDKSEIKKLVVIIDDLDRCTPDRIIENLEAIKLFLNVEKTAFVIGADPRIVRHAIDYRYKTKYQIEDDSNSRVIDDYLEKLIQIPYNLPKLSDSEVETYISLLICKKALSPEVFSGVYDRFQDFRVKDRYSVYGLAIIKETIDQNSQDALSKSLISIPALVPIITHTLSGNPRQVKRFLNTLTLRQRLASVAKLSEFNDAVLIKLMVLEYSELPLFKQLYDWQVAQKGIPSQIIQLEKIASEGTFGEAKTEFDKSEFLKNWYKERVFNWLKVEPLLSNVDLSDYFWLSRDKIASTIPGTSLIPPIVKSLYLKVNQDSLPDAVSKKIIKEEISVLSEYERIGFLDFALQMIIRNPKRNRGYAIFHLLLDEKILEAEDYYLKALNNVNSKDIPIAVGEALKRYVGIEAIKKFIDTNLKDATTPLAKAFKTK
jgi:hypothetical protein